MRTNPDAPRSISIRLTEDLLKTMGLTCIWADRLTVCQEQTRLSILTIVGRRAVGEKIWFRKDREATKVYEAFLSRCFAASKTRDGILVELPYADVVDLVRLVAHSLGITPIKDDDVATTFDSLHRRIEETLATMRSDGSLKKINREYTDLVAQDEDFARRATNKANHAQIAAAYDGLSRECRDIIKADFKAERERDPTSSWNKFLASKLALSLAPRGTIKGTKPGTKGTTETIPLQSYNDWLFERLKRELALYADLKYAVNL